MFSNIETLTEPQKAEIYADIYLYALAIPVISIAGVAIASVQRWMRERQLAKLDGNEKTAGSLTSPETQTQPDYRYFVGGFAFICLTLLIGLSNIPFSQEIILTGSMAIVLLLMRQLIWNLEETKARELIGTAIIIFVFRSVPLPGAGATWFEIDVLGFDQQFLSVLSLITSLLAMLGMIILRPLMASRSITYIVMLLTLFAGVLALPNIGLYYGIHHWTAPLTGGIVDAQFIAIIDTAVESPLGQVAMIPMLAWIARNAPENLKATFFAVMASFTNLALSTSNLLTKHLNQLFLVTREVRDASGKILIHADYSELGWLLITVAAVSVAAPLLTILVVQSTMLRTTE
jgi:hypothetical protein